jgi:hypothetical protein
MTEKTTDLKKRDYSCEIISFIVLVVLSELSHFWYVAIAICVGIIFWGAIVLVGQMVLSAAGALPWRPRASRTNNGQAGDSGNQVFQPAKIRQSVDC